jgi:hypothetical protein
LKRKKVSHLDSSLLCLESIKPVGIKSRTPKRRGALTQS